ncbi:DNA-formamidopyrimidine glycosylase [Alicyclobacillus sp. SO9]|uniref:DNA-formamidopyrimidine glycosylase n=1 Tax=Alicyclobacillus sp. SO9 TaxID=2665646 RepID=UPI0018E83DC3|nr:DNA-formamidopyrimidine glycosylase [Alicyclobacillus sp. SO9]QQE78011.1 DNA-formamidopyrimidine glycosylase [Alicyclobacillus sp. SO9]
MPELPEVENVKRSLESLVVGKTIKSVYVGLPRIIRTPDDVLRFQAELAGCTIKAVARRGKYLIFEVPPFQLVSHLRMEGQYRFVEGNEEIAPHTHVIFHFTDGSELRYRDVRQFGTMDLVSEGGPLPKGLSLLGPEPFDEALTPAVFYQILHTRKAPVKAVLLNQECLAGLGNIYVDEALFAAEIHPARTAEKVTKRQAEKLLKEIQIVLEKAIAAGGSSIRTYVNGYGRHGGFQLQLEVYARDGQPCRRCGSLIEKTRVAGRGTHYCPQCQPRPRDRKKRSIAAKP